MHRFGVTIIDIDPKLALSVSAAVNSSSALLPCSPGLIWDAWATAAPPTAKRPRPPLYLRGRCAGNVPSPELVREMLPKGLADSQVHCWPDVQVMDACIEQAPLYPLDNAVRQRLECDLVPLIWPDAGKGSRIVIIDTGIDAAALNVCVASTCPESARFHIDTGRSFDSYPSAKRKLDSAIRFPRAARVVSRHGTMVAACAVMFANNATIVDVCSVDWHERHVVRLYSSIVRALEGVVQLVSEELAAQSAAPTIVNLSLQVSPFERLTTSDANLLAPVADSALEALEDLGVDVIMAAGNCAEVGCLVNPARKWRVCGLNASVRVLTVGAACVGHDSPEAAAYSADGIAIPPFGRKPDIAHYANYRTGGADKTTDRWGTSVASPAVAGIVAAIRTKHRMPPAELRQILRLATIPSAPHSALGHGVISIPLVARLLPIA